MALPPLTGRGELPQGLHLATLREVLERFGVGSRQRRAVALRLERIYKPEPNDLDVFLLMEDTWETQWVMSKGSEGPC